MILSDHAIKEAIEHGTIVIEPFRADCLGSNSYDVHLGKTLALYEGSELDAKKANSVRYFDIPKEGFLLEPQLFYLGVTEEYTETLCYVPFLEGKSSVGRLGIDIHATAGKGDVGFKNFWTLEISVKMPVRVYAGMPIGQIIYFVVEGEVLTPYHAKESAKYKERSPLPQPSFMWRNNF
jgi:dCTP deaminase